MDDKSLENIHASSDNLYAYVRLIVETAQRQAYTAVNVVLVQRNWLIGKQIAEEELKGESRAEYGAEVIKQLSKYLTEEFGKGFAKTNLYQFYQFFKCFPNIFHSVSGNSVLLTLAA